MVGDLGDGLVLRGLQGAPLLDPGGEFAPARWLIHEWRDYSVEWANPAEARGPIELIGLRGSQWRRVGGAAAFGFSNQLGLARLRVRAEGVEVPLVLEVLSPKFPTAAAHRAFFDPLVSQLSHWAAALPFTLEEPTAIRTAESSRPRSDLFAWHFLRQEGDAILAALRLILNEPRRLLTVVDDVVGIGESAGFDERTLLEVAGRPERLAPVPETSAARGWPLAKRLRQARSGRRFLPTELTSSRAEETLDTPEHRFVKAFLSELTNTADRLLARRDLPEAGRRSVRSLGGEIQEALAATFLSEVGPLETFPWASRILQRADGYRTLLQAWRKYQQALDPFESLDQATDARDVATLYEWWCFYALVRRLSHLRTLRKISGAIDDVAGLPHGLTAAFDDGWTLMFNHYFGHGSGAWQSYSVPLRPDFILARDGVPLVALDAKFRFEAADWQVAGEASDGYASESHDGASVSMGRLAKAADIYKMHTYRDALGLRSCVAVYPGTRRDRGVFYDSDAGATSGLPLGLLLDELGPGGVGSLPLSPEDGDGDPLAH